MMYAMRKDRIMGDTRRRREQKCPERTEEVLRGRGSRAAVRSKETRWETTGTKRRGSNPPRENDRPAALLQMGGGL